MPQTVLIVEDEPLALASISFFLRDHGYRIVQATDGSEALKLLESKLKIDMVLSDIALPGIDGYQVLQRVRYRLPGTPVILMSGNFTLGCPPVRHGGADAYVSKPLDLEELLREIDVALGKRSVDEYTPLTDVKGSTVFRPSFQPPQTNQLAPWLESSVGIGSPGFG